VAVIETGYVCRAEAWNVKTVHICTVENNWGQIMYSYSASHATSASATQ
jgi:hypothetical protein